MTVLSEAVVGLVALLHIWFLVLEMFLWKRPFGMKTFGLSREEAETTGKLAANQGLYNGFLAAGLIWGLAFGGGFPVLVFFLACVIVAGVFGAFTAKRTILWVQAVPGAVAMVLVLLARG